jgi:predicted Zn finger-like uncharacterized protein
MVIQCSACDTRFKIADDKLKAGGVKVRCSKCQEIFTVMPPEEEPVAETAVEDPAQESAPSESDWADLNASFDTPDTSDDGQEEEPESGGWDNIGGESASESTEDAAPSFDDFSFGDDEPAGPPADEFSFGVDSSTGEETPSDEFSFGDTAADDEPESEPVISEDAFAFSGSVTTDDILEESHGQGIQNDFAFDDNDSPEIAAAGGNDDFDWDDGGVESDSFNFDAASDEDENLDFSGISLQEDEPEPAPTPAPVPPPAPAAEPESKRPESAKGPQKSAPSKKRPIKGRHSAKKKGPWGSLVALVLFLALVLGGSLYGMQRMGFWSGDFAELGAADYSGFAQTLWTRANAQIQAMLGGSAAVEPVGTIGVVEMSGRFIDNKSAGRLFVIDGKVRNDFPKSRSAIAIRGLLYNAAGKPVANQKVFCGNALSTAELSSLPVEKLLERGKNQFGDSLSNLDVAPQATLPFTIVFGKTPKDIVEFNVEIVDSAPGSQP